MVDIKLGKLPDRTLLKLTIGIHPDLNHSLGRYAAFYNATYRQEEAVAELIPAIVSAFLESDRAFIRWCREATDRNE
ncbi:MAG: DUF2274 domain-containing protein [Candidatus Sphingomonas colombiensis]|nr:DUF2274 domain-containing protein [Sphingomonas sp.]WEK43372.1 MAG: DUF2274 domain-containing protein [Sphingomonas sp.]